MYLFGVVASGMEHPCGEVRDGSRHGLASLLEERVDVARRHQRSIRYRRTIEDPRRRSHTAILRCVLATEQSVRESLTIVGRDHEREGPTAMDESLCLGRRLAARRELSTRDLVHISHTLSRAIGSTGSWVWQLDDSVMDGAAFGPIHR